MSKNNKYLKAYFATTGDPDLDVIIAAPKASVARSYFARKIAENYYQDSGVAGSVYISSRVRRAPHHDISIDGRKRSAHILPEDRLNVTPGSLKN